MKKGIYNATKQVEQKNHFLKKMFCIKAGDIMWRVCPYYKLQR